MRTFRRAALIVLALGVLPAAAADLATATIPFPRAGVEPVGIANGPMRIRSVYLKNRPSAREVEHARRRDRDDTTALRWVFFVSNSGRRDWKARIHVAVVDRGGRLLAENSREDEVDARRWRDHISVWTRIRTADYPAADRAVVEVRFHPD